MMEEHESRRKRKEAEEKLNRNEKKKKTEENGKKLNRNEHEKLKKTRAKQEKHSGDPFLRYPIFWTYVGIRVYMQIKPQDITEDSLEVRTPAVRNTKLSSGNSRQVWAPDWGMPSRFSAILLQFWLVRNAFRLCQAGWKPFVIFLSLCIFAGTLKWEEPKKHTTHLCANQNKEPFHVNGRFWHSLTSPKTTNKK